MICHFISSFHLAHLGRACFSGKLFEALLEHVALGLERHDLCVNTWALHLDLSSRRPHYSQHILIPICITYTNIIWRDCVALAACWQTGKAGNRKEALELATCRMSACTSELGSLAISLRHTYPHVSLHTCALRAVCATVLMASELAALAVHTQYSHHTTTQPQIITIGRCARIQRQPWPL